MALAAATVWEIRTTGAATNGGGWVAGAAGTDWSQQDAAQYSVTDGVTAGTTTITSATANFGTDVVGNIMYVQGGTGSVAAGRYQITARASATSITVDRSTGLTAGTGVTLIIGGAMSDPALVAAAVVTGNTIWQRAGTYTITSASTNVAGGCITLAVRYYWEGYQTTRGDMGTSPLMQASGISTATLFTVQNSGNQPVVRNVKLDGASLTSIRGFFTSGGGILDACVAINCTNYGIVIASTSYAFRCLVTGCSTQPAYLVNSASAIVEACIAADNASPGFSMNGGVAIRCIADSNTGASSDGFVHAGVPVTYKHCVAYGNGRDGFGTVISGAIWSNNLAEGNGRYGFIYASGTTGISQTNGAYNNTTANENGTPLVREGFITGTGSFFVGASTGNFALNATAGAGASAQAVSSPTVLPGGGTTNYLDVGAAQHEDAGGASYSRGRIVNT